MTAMADLSRRALLKVGGALVVSFSLDAAWPARAETATTLKTDLGKTVDANEVDGFLAVHPDGSVTIFSGKVDLGTGFRIAIRQMVAEELNLAARGVAGGVLKAINLPAWRNVGIDMAHVLERHTAEGAL